MENTEDIRLIIIEDELHNSRMLNDLVEKLRPYWKVDAILESVEESVNWLRKNPAPDLLLVDIQLSDGTCFSIFQKVALDPSSKIVFTTAYDEYAIRAFKVNSIDYLLKPIKMEDLKVAFEKFEQLNAEKETRFQNSIFNKEQLKELVDSIIKGKKEYRTRFLISGVKSYTKLDTKDIAFIYSHNKITIAVDRSKREYVLEYSLEQLEEELDPRQFYRANRKIIVDIDAVRKVKNDTGGKLCLLTTPETDFEVTISRLKVSEFKNWLGK